MRNATCINYSWLNTDILELQLLYIRDAVDSKVPRIARCALKSCIRARPLSCYMLSTGQSRKYRSSSPLDLGRKSTMLYKRPLIAILTAILAHANAASFMDTCESFELIEGHLLKLNSCKDPRYWDISDWRSDSFMDLGECYSNKNGKLSLDKGYEVPSICHLFNISLEALTNREPYHTYGVSTDISGEPHDLG